jgi:hypothetical protein
LESQVVDASGTAAFTTLTPFDPYAFYARVDGEHRWLSRRPSPPSRLLVCGDMVSSRRAAFERRLSNVRTWQDVLASRRRSQGTE